MTKDEALKLALEALDGAHIDRAYGYIQEALAQPEREPLTDAEIWQMVNDCSFNRDLHADKFARAIEAAHGIGDKT